jgi:hypothetical protein
VSRCAHASQQSGRPKMSAPVQFDLVDFGKHERSNIQQVLIHAQEYYALIVIVVQF